MAFLVQLAPCLPSARIGGAAGQLRRKWNISRRSGFLPAAPKFRLTASVEPNGKADPKSLASVVFQYFENWNKRQIESILPVFAPEVYYEDALYPKALQGREALHSHLIKVARVLPRNFVFVIDNVCEDPGRGTCAVRFHLKDERSGKQVPFSRGTSFFTAREAPETADGWLITSGWDLPEPFLKAGNLLLGFARFAATIANLLDRSRE